jgi:hypothetical protein
VTLYVCWAVVRVTREMSVASWKYIVPARKREASDLCDYERLVKTEASVDRCGSDSKISNGSYPTTFGSPQCHNC